MICKAQFFLSRHEDFRKSKNLMALILSRGLNQSHAMVYAALGDTSFCKNVLEVRKSLYWALVDHSKLPPKPAQIIHFMVDSSNIPVSSNPLWNECIRGEHANRGVATTDCKRDTFTDRDGTWYHPDFPNLSFEFVLRDPRGHKYPENFALVVLGDDMNQDDMLVAARELNRAEDVSSVPSSLVVTGGGTVD